ncbi:MAG: periplasmic heavy metal sensor [Syntrophobacteraceae bacterium]|nr:periplasmic heavy metal sensor [Syntrophobacteraceae bacterium]
MSAVLALALAALGISDAAARGYRHGGMGGDGPGMGFGMIRMLDRMDLSQDQKQQVASILKTHRDDIAKTMTEGSEARAKLRDAMQAKDYSEASVQGAAAAMAAHQEKMILLRAKVMSEIRLVLTPEQNEQMVEFPGRRGGRMRGATDAMISNLDRWIAEHGK